MCALFSDNRFEVIILHASKRPEWELISIYAAEAMTVTKDNRIFLKKRVLTKIPIDDKL